jgi:cytoskeletal protein CcmA (bactofilin family)
MFASKQRGTVIAKGLKIVGSVTAEGLVEVNGQIDGELHCTSLVKRPVGTTGPGATRSPKTAAQIP